MKIKAPFRFETSGKINRNSSRRIMYVSNSQRKCVDIYMLRHIGYTADGRAGRFRVVSVNQIAKGEA